MIGGYVLMSNTIFISKLLKFSILKTVALSETTTRGNLKIEKKYWSFLTVELEVVLDIM